MYVQHPSPATMFCTSVAAHTRRHESEMSQNDMNHEEHSTVGLVHWYASMDRAIPDFTHEQQLDLGVLCRAMQDRINTRGSEACIKLTLHSDIVWCARKGLSVIKAYFVSVLSCVVPTEERTRRHTQAHTIYNPLYIQANTVGSSNDEHHKAARGTRHTATCSPNGGLKYQRDPQ
jgi:hypothetical protein